MRSTGTTPLSAVMVETMVTAVAAVVVTVTRAAVAEEDMEEATTVATIATVNLPALRLVPPPRPPLQLAPQTMLPSMLNTMGLTLTLPMVVTKTTSPITTITSSMPPLSNNSSSNSPKALLLPLPRVRHPLRLPQALDLLPLPPVPDLLVPVRAATE